MPRLINGYSYMIFICNIYWKRQSRWSPNFYGHRVSQGDPYCWALLEYKIWKKPLSHIWVKTVNLSIWDFPPLTEKSISVESMLVSFFIILFSAIVYTVSKILRAILTYGFLTFWLSLDGQKIFILEGEKSSKYCKRILRTVYYKHH